MKNSTCKQISLLALLALAAVGCAKEDTINTGEKAQMYLKMFIEKYYPYVEENEYGLFVLEDTPGTGRLWSADSAYTYASTTIRALDGTITSTTDENLARQLGTYVWGNYYGPKYQQLGENVSYAGLDRLFTGMRQGGTRKAIIPSWLLSTKRYGTEKEYIDACSSEQHLEYTVTLVSQSTDITQTEKDSLARYVKRHYGDIQPSAYNEYDADGSFYFISDSTAFIGKDRFPADTTIKINYTGMLLNGQVFDTTVEKVAKDAGIYKSSRKYEPSSLTVSTNYSEFKLDDNSVITGFEAGLKKMRWLGQHATVIFISSIGYQSSGSGATIPPYSPLLFELELQ